VTSQLKSFEVWVLSGTPDAIMATLARAGAVLSDATGGWVLPSADDPRVLVSVYFGASLSMGPQKLGMSIQEYALDPDVPPEELWARCLSQCSGITIVEAKDLIRRAAAWITASSEDRAAATTALPQLVQTILAAHEGVAYDDARCWNSEDARAGRVEGMDHWPFPSIEEEYRRSDAVFLGRATTVSWEGSGDTTGQSVHVIEVLRGNLPRTTAIAGPKLVVGPTYLLFVRRVGSSLVVDWHGNSGSLPSAGAALAEVRRMTQAEKEH
jgi:hypothetical protein